jgi:hypothetical protein
VQRFAVKSRERLSSRFQLAEKVTVAGPVYSGWFVAFFTDQSQCISSGKWPTGRTGETGLSFRVRSDNRCIERAEASNISGSLLMSQERKFVICYGL